MAPIRERSKHQIAPAGKGETHMSLLVILLIVAAIFVGLGFVVKWLFIVAVIAALLALISWFTGRRHTV
jgi:hypothetical protein